MNISNFRKVLAYIEKHPEQWRQSSCHHCFLATAHFLEEGLRYSFGTSGLEFLGIDLGDRMGGWIFNPDRTLDDFRRVSLIYGGAS